MYYLVDKYFAEYEKIKPLVLPYNNPVFLAGIYEEKIKSLKLFLDSIDQELNLRKQFKCCNDFELANYESFRYYYIQLVEMAQEDTIALSYYQKSTNTKKVAR